MGEIVPVSSTSGALIAQDPQKEAELREQRIQEAQELEIKLKKINEADQRICNVSGSAAGAGSGDFHYYRLIRRKEQDRLRKMEQDDKAKQEREDFEAKQQQALTELEARTAKKRAKRLKKKAKKKQKTSAAPGGADASGSDGSGDESNDEKAATAAAVPQQQDVD